MRSDSLNTSPTSFFRGFDEGGLWVQASDRADDGLLDAFFPVYDLAFVLPHEKEGLEGFQECLALNFGAAHETLSARHGVFRELVLVARETSGGPVVGGANFLVLLGPLDQADAVSYTINLNYLFVDPALRGQGLSRKILSACIRLAEQLAQVRPVRHAVAAPNGLVFLEVNDPFRLTPEAYRIDSEHAGIDQLARLAYWARMGARLLDWPYVQPALSSLQEDDDTLAMAVMGSSADRLSAELVLRHLERFFAISVLKGLPLASSESAWRQVQALRQLAEQSGGLPLLDLSDPSSRLQKLLHRGAGRPTSLVAALKEREP